MFSPLRALKKCKLVGYCILVQGSLLIDACGSEKGVMVNASGGRLAQEKSLLLNNATIPQCHSLPVPTTKSTLKPTFYSLIHPSEPDALSPCWDINAAASVGQYVMEGERALKSWLSFLSFKCAVSDSVEQSSHFPLPPRNT